MIITSNNVSTSLLLNNYTYIRYFHYILYASYTLLCIFHIFSPCFSQDSFLWPILQYTKISLQLVYSVISSTVFLILITKTFSSQISIFFQMCCTFFKKWILISLNTVSIVLESLFVSFYWFLSTLSCVLYA